MRLRPHHLLCTQSYEGKGYDDAFVDNMNRITELLGTGEPVVVEMVFSTDDLCAACPKMLGTDLCQDNEKVKGIDERVIRHFEIEEKTYIYQDLIRNIRENMTPEILEDICGTCSWYSLSRCREILTNE